MTMYPYSIYDYVVNMSVVLNSIKYPSVGENASFTKYQFSQVYMYMKEFTRDYYGMDPLVN